MCFTALKEVSLEVVCSVLVCHVVAILSSSCESYGLAKPVFKFPNMFIHNVSFVLCLQEFVLSIILSQVFCADLSYQLDRPSCESVTFFYFWVNENPYFH